MDFLSKFYTPASILLINFYSIDALNNLQNRLLNIQVVQLPIRKQYTLKDVSAHCIESDCWMVIKDLVYDVTDFMREVCLSSNTNSIHFFEHL